MSKNIVIPCHLRGGIATLTNGVVLWSTGDCTLFGIDGAYIPQLNQKTCGKILRIDPTTKGACCIVAKRVHNL